MRQWSAEGLTYGDYERGPKTFAAGEDTPADRGVDAFRRFGGFGDETIEFRVDTFATRRKKLLGVY